MSKSKELMPVGNKDIWTFIWRGALGGAIGILLFFVYAMVGQKLTDGYIPYLPLLIIGIPVYLLYGALLGMIIGLIVWGCFIKSGRNLGINARAFIGMVSAFILWLLLRLVSKGDAGGAGSKLPLIVQIVSSLMAIFNLGALPAMMARPKSGRSDAD